MTFYPRICSCCSVLKRRKEKKIVWLLLLIFSYQKGIQCKAFLWLFVVSKSQKCVFDSFAYMRSDSKRTRNRGLFKPQAMKSETVNPCFAQCFFSLFLSLCRSFVFKRVFLSILNNNIKNLFKNICEINMLVYSFLIYEYIWLKNMVITFSPLRGCAVAHV